MGAERPGIADLYGDEDGDVVVFASAESASWRAAAVQLVTSGAPESDSRAVAPHTTVRRTVVGDASISAGFRGAAFATAGQPQQTQQHGLQKQQQHDLQKQQQQQQQQQQRDLPSSPSLPSSHEQAISPPPQPQAKRWLDDIPLSSGPAASGIATGFLTLPYTRTLPTATPHKSAQDPRDLVRSFVASPTVGGAGDRIAQRITVDGFPMPPEAPAEQAVPWFMQDL
jgi:type II secretory pathway pseudopilin PulG